MLLKVKEVDLERTQIRSQIPTERSQFLAERSQAGNSDEWQVASGAKSSGEWRVVSGERKDGKQESGDRSQKTGARI